MFTFRAVWRGMVMPGTDETSGSLFIYFDPEEHI